MKKILFVDDEPDLRSIFRIFISNIGNVEFLEASNGREGVEIAKAHKPDLIIMDYKMPEMNGLDAVRQIKNSVLTESIPIILYTGYANEFDETDVMTLGCNEVLYKPINVNAWIEKISKYLP